MKRVTLLADDVRELAGSEYRHLLLPGSTAVQVVHAQHILAVEGVSGLDLAPLDPTAPPAAPRVLTADELVALPVGSVVDATATGARVRAMMTETGEWVMSFCLDGSRMAMPRELEDAALVPTPPIQPAPVAPLPLPTEPGERFWGRSVDEPEPQYWFVRGPASTEEAHDTAARALVYYVPSRSSDSIVRAAVAQSVGLVYLGEKAPEVTA